MAEKPALTKETVCERRSNLLLQLFYGFVSMRTGIFLLLILIAVSFIGTFIPPGKEHILLGDVYHTWWFRLLLAILCLNILACSAVRLPLLWRSTVSPPIVSPVKLDSLPHYIELKTAASVESVAVTTALTLARCGLRVKTAKTGSGPVIYADSGRIASWGTLAVHLSIVLILAGALYGNLYGFDRDIALPVGSSIEISGSQYPGLRQPFSLTLSNFTTQYYSDETVSDWISEITVEQDGRKLFSRAVKVNQPLEFEDIMIYQFSYGINLNTQITDTSGNLVSEESVAERGMLENRGFVIRPIRFIPDFNPLQPMVSASPEPRNPHVLYIIYQDGREVDWGAAKLGETIPLAKTGGNVKFTEAKPFSGLQIKYDPGVPAVWLGFIMMTVGFFFSLYPRRLRFWITVSPGDYTVIRAGGQGSPSLFAHLTKSLNKRLNSDTASGRKT